MPEKTTPPKPVERFVVFGFGDLYPAGGWWDFVGSSESLTGAEELARKSNANSYRDNWQIVDLSTGEVHDAKL